MSTVNSEIIMQGNNDAWFTANASVIYPANIQIFHIDGRYKFSDGVTTLSALPFLGALGYTPENIANKQNSLAVDGTGTKYVTVDAVNTGLATKQDTLVSGTNIRTVNGSTLLGSTNLQVGTILGTLPATAGLIPFANGTMDTVETSNTFIRDSNGNIGIKTAIPLASIHVGNNNVNNSSDSQILISRIVNSGTGNGHAFSDSSNFSRSGNVAYNSYDARVVFSGTNNYDHYAAFQSNPTLNFTGNMTDYFGYFSQVSIVNGTITNNYGAYIKDVDGVANSVVNNYGVYIDNLTKGSTNNYAIYSNGGAKSYFGGVINTNSRIGVGGNFTPTKNIEIQTASGVEASLRIRQLGQNFWDFTIPVNQTRLDIVDSNGINVTFKNLGNVGIKTINPLARLHIVSDVNNHALRAENASNLLFFVQTNGNALHGFNTYFGGSTGVALTPTAFVHLAPSTTTTPQLLFTNGVAPTTPANGAVWFDGTDLKMRVGGVTKTFTLT